MRDDFPVLLNDSFRFISFRPRSSAEMTLYLEKRVKKKKYDVSLVVRVLTRLEELGYVNDEKFAADWIESRSRGKKLGPVKLRQELKRKGISEEIITNSLSGSVHADKESQTTLARQALEKRVARWQKLPLLACKRKVYDFLLRRGFSSSLAVPLVDEYCAKTYNTGCENND